VLRPDGAAQEAPGRPRAHGYLRGELLSQTVRKAPEEEWLEAKGKRLPTLAFDVECSVSVPPGQGQVLLLLQFPGHEREQRPSRVQVTLNGNAVAVRDCSSGGHVEYQGPNYGVWQGMQAFESQWTWYICDLGAGASRVRFTGLAAHPQCRIGLWAWHESDLGGGEVSTRIACSEPAMPLHRPDIERQGVCLRKPL